jgi:hypothetical protein
LLVLRILTTHPCAPLLKAARRIARSDRGVDPRTLSFSAPC